MISVHVWLRLRSWPFSEIIFMTASAFPFKSAVDPKLFTSWDTQFYRLFGICLLKVLLSVFKFYWDIEKCHWVQNFFIHIECFSDQFLANNKGKISLDFQGSYTWCVSVNFSLWQEKSRVLCRTYFEYCVVVPILSFPASLAFESIWYCPGETRGTVSDSRDKTVLSEALHEVLSMRTCWLVLE